MATSDVKVTEGSGKNVSTYSITEDAETKQIQRISLNNSAGTEIGTTTNTVSVDDGVLSINKSSTPFATTLAANVPSSVTTLAATEWDGTAFTPRELEISTSGAAIAYVKINPITKSASTSVAGTDVMTVTGHGMGTTNVYAAVFTSVSFTSSPTLTVNTVIYYLKGSDANSLKVYTDAAASSLVDITSAAAATFFLSAHPGTATSQAYYDALLLNTPMNVVLPSYNVTPTRISYYSAGTPVVYTILRGA